ncbi:MAG: ABC transporter permease [Actinomycetota bacterium]|nr:ABC transporter permease [Actinomycetota bacterium]
MSAFIAAIRRQPAPLLAGLAILTPFLVMCVFPGLLAPYEPLKIEALPLLGPSREHLLGTDEIGRDLLSRCIYAARTDIFVSLAAAAVAFVIGTAIGLFSGYIGGRVDTVTMRLIDVLLSFPTIVLALFLITIFGREQWVQILAIGLVMMPSTARFSRGEGLVLRGRGYVEASRISGGSRWHILVKHVLPNSLATLLVAASVLASSAVLISASLSYLGLGAQPPEPSWGNMLRAAYGVVYDAPLYGVGAGVCISLVAGAYILIGEGLRRKFRNDRNVGTLSSSIGGL